MASNPACDNDGFADLAGDKAKLHLFSASEAFGWSIHINIWALANAKVNERSQPPLTFDLSLSEPAGSGSLHRFGEPLA